MKKIVRPKEAIARLGIGKTKYWEDIRSGVLPPLVHLGPQARGHFEDELDEYLERLRAQRDAKLAA